MKEGISAHLLPFLKDKGLEEAFTEPALTVLKGRAIAGLSTWY